MSLSKTLYPLLSTGLTQEMSQHDSLITDFFYKDVKHEIKQDKMIYGNELYYFRISDRACRIITRMLLTSISPCW